MAPDHTFPGNQLEESSDYIMSSRPYLASSNEITQIATPNQTLPPPLPPRVPVQNSGYNNYRYGLGNHYWNGNTGYGGGYRGCGGYGLMGGNYPSFSDMSMYNNYGGYNMENRFQQHAEESTRSAFQMIETTLNTFSSITMALESTYFAITNSFRAILSVADNIGKVRSTIGDLLSTLALIRSLKWIYNKILFLLGLRKQEDILHENLWQKTLIQAANSESSGSTSTWANLLLITAFVSIPYLIHKISNNVKNIHVQVNDPKSWLESEDPVKVAFAMYDFAAGSDEELNLRTGQKIWLAPKFLQPKSMPGWFLATDNKNVGLVPSNYVTIKGQVMKPKFKNDSNSAMYQAVQPVIQQKIEKKIDDTKKSTFVNQLLQNTPNTTSSPLSDEQLQIQKEVIDCAMKHYPTYYPKMFQEENTSNTTSKENTLNTILKENTLSTIPEENTLSTIPEENTLSTIPEENILSTIPKENTLSTIPEENTLSTIPEENTLSTILKKNIIDDTL